MKLKIKKLHADAVTPKYQTRGSAGFDLVSVENVTFGPGETKIVKTGLAVDTGDGFQLEVRDRSGMVLKTPLRVANSPGTVDSDYRGEVGILMQNTGANPYTLEKGTRAAQGLIMPAIQADIEVTDYLDETDRGAGGYGSTGK